MKRRRLLQEIATWFNAYPATQNELSKVAEEGTLGDVEAILRLFRDVALHIERTEAA